MACSRDGDRHDIAHNAIASDRRPTQQPELQAAIGDGAVVLVNECVDGVIYTGSNGSLY